MTVNRWKTFSKSQQLLMIGSEIMRAKVWQNKNEQNFAAALERGRKLVELSLADAQWKDSKPMLVGLEQELKNFAVKTRTDDIGTLYRAL